MLIEQRSGSEQRSATASQHSRSRRLGIKRPSESTYSHDEKYPGLGISRGLQDLILFEVVVLDALSICCHSLHSDYFLVGGEKAGGRRQIGHEDQEDSS